MKKILTDTEIEALKAFRTAGGAAYNVVKSIFDFYEKDLENIKNVDPKANVGLQTVARQEALKTFEEMRDLIFKPEGEPADKNAGIPQKEKISQWR